jgi:ATP phosphoribosyltransferase
MEDELQLRLGLPKGSLQKATFDMLARAGYHCSVGSRSYYPTMDDSEIEPVLMRAQEIPRYVAAGALDAGLSGLDWIMETEADVVEVCDLVYSKASRALARWVLAVAQDSTIDSPKGLEGKRVATEVVNVTRKYFADKGVEVEVEFSWGATEVKVPELVDAIVELTETGASLAANNLRIIDTVLETNTKLIANRGSWEDARKRAKVETLSMLLQGALLGEEKVGLKMNVPRADLDKVLKLLPALRQPTVSALTNEDWVAIETVLDEREARDLIPELRRAGAEGIVEYPLNKVIP